jgi:hypothetical protein
MTLVCRFRGRTAWRGIGPWRARSPPAGRPSPTVADRRDYTTEATVRLDRQSSARSDVFVELAVDSPQHEPCRRHHLVDHPLGRGGDLVHDLVHTDGLCEGN